MDTQAIRKKVLELALQGKLTEQLPEDGTAEELYKRILGEEKYNSEKQVNISDDEKPYEIPSTWLYVRLNNIANLHNGRAYSQDELLDKGKYPVLRVGNLFTNKNWYYSDMELEPVKYCDKGDLLYAWSASFGPYIWNGGKVIYHYHIWKVEHSRYMNRKYLYYYLLADTNNIKKATHGMAMLHATKASTEQRIIVLPPLAEQHRIVEKVESIFSILDTIDVLQTQYQNNITALKSKLIDAAIQGELTEQLPEDGTAEELYQEIQQEKKALEQAGRIKNKSLPSVTDDEKPFNIPANWMWVRLDDITQRITSGNTPPGGKKSNAYVETGYCFFREQNIYNDGIHEQGMVYISEELINQRENSTVIAKDLLLNITGGSIGRCAVVPDDFTRGSVNQHILIIRMVNEWMRYYVHTVICGDYAQQYIKKKAVGDKDGFSGGRCKSMPIPLPPLAEQRRIVARLEELLALCDQN